MLDCVVRPLHCFEGSEYFGEVLEASKVTQTKVQRVKTNFCPSPSFLYEVCKGFVFCVHFSRSSSFQSSALRVSHYHFFHFIMPNPTD